MTNLKKAFKSYRSAGSFNELLAIAAFVADDIFITKSGDLGMVLKIDGIDYETTPVETLEDQAKRLAGALKGFNDEFRVYQYILKRDGIQIPRKADYGSELITAAVHTRADYLEQKPERLYEIELYVVVLLESKRFLSRPVEKSMAWLQSALPPYNRLTVQRRELQRSCRLLSDRVKTFVVATADLIQPRILTKADAFTFFRGLFNLTPGKAEAFRLKHDAFLDYYTADEALAVTEEGLKMGGNQHIRVFSMKEEPGQTYVNLLSRLHTLPCNFIACSEFRAVPNLVMRAKIKKRQRYFDAARYPLIGLALRRPKEDMIEDKSAVDSIDQLTESLKDLNNGNYFGEFALTVILYGTDKADLQRGASELDRIFRDLDGSMIQEIPNALHVYASICPGNSKLQIRKFHLLNLDYLNMAFAYAIQQGSQWNAYIHDEYLAVYETNFSTPYFLNLHTEKLIGGLVMGNTGSGKSLNANYLITGSQKYKPFTLILDIGGSYEEMTRSLRGVYAHLNLEKQSFRINPFSLPESKDNFDFLTLFVKMLVETGGRAVDSRQADDIFQSIRRLYNNESGQRTLSNLIVHKDLREALGPWVRGGQFGNVFDNAQDDITFARFQTYDLKGMEKKNDLLSPLMFYILHRFSAVVNDPANLGSLKILWIDEAWQFMQNDACKKYVIEAGKTWRKVNGGIVVITQSLADLEKAGVDEVIRSVCPMKIFLPDPGADKAKYQKAFDLNDREVEVLSSLTPQKQFLLKTPSYSKVLNLNLDPKSLWLYTTAPLEVKRRREVFAQYGAKRGLDILTHSAAEEQRFEATA